MIGDYARGRRFPSKPQIFPASAAKKMTSSRSNGSSVQARPEVAPDRHSVTSVPPGGKSQIQQEEGTDYARRTNEEPQQQRDANEQLDRPDRIAEEDSVGQNDVRQNWTIETHSRAGNVVAKISLKAAVREARTRNLILAEK